MPDQNVRHVEPGPARVAQRELGTADGIVLTEHRVLITARDPRPRSLPLARC